MKLDDYLTSAGIQEADFGKEIGLSQSQINRLRRGLSRPSWNTVLAISKKTDQRVTADDWAEQARVA